VIEVRDLEFAYERSAFRLRVPRLEIAEGETVAVVGVSGSGKTTLLNLVSGVLPVPVGAVSTHGTSLAGLDDPARRRFRLRNIGMVFQEFELLPYLNVMDNILLPYRISPALKLDGGVRDRARALAEGMGLGALLGRGVRRLSQGERQRVAVCRALVTEPPLLLCDEPTGNLDPTNKGHVLDLLLGFSRRRGATLVTVTHDHGILDRFDRTLSMEEFHGEARP